MTDQDRELSRKLKDEVKETAFSEQQKAVLRCRVSEAMLHGTSEKSRKSIWDQVRRFWNGYTEIPLPVAAVAIVFIALGVGERIVGLYFVDQTTAVLLLQVGETIKAVNQGVSVL